MNDKAVIVIGAGGHAKVLIDALLLNSCTVLGVLDSDPNLSGTNLLGCPVLGNDELLEGYPADEVSLVNAIGSIDLPLLRRKIFLLFKQQGYEFKSVIHPSAIVSDHSEVQEGAQIMAGAVIQAGVTLAENVIINTRASVDHDCRISAHSHIAPGATLSGGVMVGTGVHVGSGATLIQGIEIGDDVTVGAGAVVVSNVPAGVKIAGVPARALT